MLNSVGCTVTSTAPHNCSLLSPVACPQKERQAAGDGRCNALYARAYLSIKRGEDSTKCQTSTEPRKASETRVTVCCKMSPTTDRGKACPGLVLWPVVCFPKDHESTELTSAPALVPAQETNAYVHEPPGNTLEIMLTTSEPLMATSSVRTELMTADNISSPQFCHKKGAHCNGRGDPGHHSGCPSEG